MRYFIGKTLSHPALFLGSAVLWGVLEFIALQRSRLNNLGNSEKRRA